MIDTGNLLPILRQVNLTINKHNEISNLTGKNFNIFEILNVQSDELKHSSFISSLLDVTGNHGQQDLFLIEFIKVLSSKSYIGQKNIQSLNSYNCKSSKIQTEHFIGNITFNEDEGGRIDILLDDDHSRIIIENKIYAGDQYKQLIRYHNFDPKAVLIYLTLNENNPEAHSYQSDEKSLIEGVDFISISYEIEIVQWITNCIQIAYDKPHIRETLNQYLILLNKLTNKNKLDKMTNEIVDLLTNEFTAFQTIINSKDLVYRKLLSILNDQLKYINADVQLVSFDLSDRKESSFSFTNDILEKNNLIIKFEFEGNNFKDFAFGFCKENPNMEMDANFYDPLKNLFKNAFSEINTTISWPAWIYYHKYRYWSNDYNRHFGSIINEELSKNINEQIILMLEVINKFEELKVNQNLI